jgi:hypothetical protein
VSVSASVAALPDAPDALSFDQRVAVLERLQQLSELEDISVERVATAGITSLLAYRIGLRDAVRDALARLCDGTYGDCETCRRPIPPPGWWRCRTRGVVRRVSNARRRAGTRFKG